jgi:hypothetical protein
MTTIFSSAVSDRGELCVPLSGGGCVRDKQAVVIVTVRRASVEAHHRPWSRHGSSDVRTGSVLKEHLVVIL